MHIGFCIENIHGLFLAGLVNYTQIQKLFNRYKMEKSLQNFMVLVKQVEKPVYAQETFEAFAKGRESLQAAINGGIKTLDFCFFS